MTTQTINAEQGSRSKMKKQVVRKEDIEYGKEQLGEN